jgi:hypothetical protein
VNTRENLLAAIKTAEASVVAAHAALDQFNAAPENNVFESVEIASDIIEERLRDMAHSDCEGSYNCGLDTYTQEFTVAGVGYVGTLKVEYNRHDKTYYYVEYANFAVAPKESAP